MFQPLILLPPMLQDLPLPKFLTLSTALAPIFTLVDVPPPLPTSHTAAVGSVLWSPELSGGSERGGPPSTPGEQVKQQVK